MQNILITGGAGFIGIHTAITLLNKEYRLIIIDSLLNSSFRTIDKLNKFYSKDKDFNKNRIIFKKSIRFLYSHV